MPERDRYYCLIDDLLMMQMMQMMRQMKKKTTMMTTMISIVAVVVHLEVQMLSMLANAPSLDFEHR